MRGPQPTSLTTDLRSPPLDAWKSDGALNAFSSLRLHWPEYLMEAGEVAVFIFCVCAFATLLQHPSSPLRYAIVSRTFRRILMGFAIGATVVAIIHTPWGRQSGGHFNPAITLAFYRLGNVAAWDALFYAMAQFCGAVAGVTAAQYLLDGTPANPAVRFAATEPGVHGSSMAFVAEFVISFVLMLTILLVSTRDKVAQNTPYFVGALYAIFIAVESPLSGTSMNPARTFGPALYGGYWHTLWIYFVAPSLGMLAASESFLKMCNRIPPVCAKLHHANNKRCIFLHAKR